MLIKNLNAMIKVFKIKSEKVCNIARRSISKLTASIVKFGIRIKIYSRGVDRLMINPVELLKETELWIYLNSIDGKYSKNTLIFLDKINPLLDSIVDFFPFYTRHDCVHGREVIKRITQIIYADCLIPNTPCSFTASEILLLIISSYSHDLGMAVLPGEEIQLREQFGLNDDLNWKTNSSLSQYLRENHSTRGLVYIQANADELGIPQNLVTLLGDMMKAHNLSINEMEFQLGKRAAAGEKEIDVKQLACILCVADALEYSDTRVIDGIFKKLKEETSHAALLSYRENMKHVCIGNSVAIGKDGRVIFSGSFSDVEVMALAHRTIDLAEEWVKEYCEIEERSDIRRLRIKADSFIRNLDLPGVDYERLGIRMKKENIINLISSNATWSNDVAIPIRELLQNSVEACRFRNHLTPVSNEYKPRISVLFDRKKHEVIVSDNGCGMSKSIVLNNFLTVGNSRSEEATYQSHGYNSLARFGIGFWSIFTIADDARVETAPFELLRSYESVEKLVDGVNFSVNINQFKDYTVFTPKYRKSGTIITLQLKKEVELDKVFMSLQRQVYCSPVPLEISIKDEVNRILTESPSEIGAEELFGAKGALAEDNDIQVYKWASIIQNVELVLSIAYRVEKCKASFFMKDQINSMLRVLEGFHSKLSICGFAVPLSVGYLCWDIGRVGEFAVNITNPRGFRYSLDRRTLLPSIEQEEASTLINEMLHKGYRCFLKDTNAYTAEDIYNLNLQSRLHGGEVVDIYTKDSLLTALKNYPDLLCFKLKKLDKEVSYTFAKETYLNIEELIKYPTKSRFFVCQHYKSTDNLYFEAMQLIPFVYDVLSKNSNDFYYVIPPTVEASILFDNSVDSKIHILDVTITSGNLRLYVMEMGNILTPNDHPWIISDVSGSTLYEREICSTNDKDMFIFLGRYRLVLKKGSRLANVVKKYKNEGKLFAISELVVKLQELSNGHFGPEMARDWPELI